MDYLCFFRSFIPQFDSSLCGVCMYYLCSCGFTPGTSHSHNPDLYSNALSHIVTWFCYWCHTSEEKISHFFKRTFCVQLNAWGLCLYLYIKCDVKFAIMSMYMFLNFLFKKICWYLMNKLTNILCLEQWETPAAISYPSSLFRTFIKSPCIHKHIAALNNAIHHVELHMYYSFSTLTIMLLIIVFNGDNNHIFHYCRLLLVSAARKQEQNLKHGKSIHAIIF